MLWAAFVCRSDKCLDCNLEIITTHLKNRVTPRFSRCNVHHHFNGNTSPPEQVLTKHSPSFFGMHEFYRVDAQVRMNRGTNLEINSLQIFACNSKTKHHQATRLITDNNSEFKTLTSQSCCCSLEIGSRGSCTRWTHRDRGTNTLPGTRGTCVAAAVPDELPDTGI